MVCKTKHRCSNKAGRCRRSHITSAVAKNWGWICNLYPFMFLQQDRCSKIPELYMQLRLQLRVWKLGKAAMLQLQPEKPLLAADILSHAPLMSRPSGWWLLRQWGSFALSLKKKAFESRQWALHTEGCHDVVRQREPLGCPD